jgi:hypothetical protein
MKTINYLKITIEWTLVVMALGATLMLTPTKAICGESYDVTSYEQKENVNLEVSNPVFESGGMVEGKSEYTSNPVTEFFKSYPWLLGLIVAFAFVMMIRVALVNALCDEWNELLSKYKDHWVHSNCLRAEDERRLDQGMLELDYRDYLNFKKWDVAHFLKDKQLYDDVLVWSKEVEMYCN